MTYSVDGDVDDLPYASTLVMTHGGGSYEVLTLFDLLRNPSLTDEHHEQYECKFSFSFVDCKCIEGVPIDKEKVLDGLNEIADEDEEFTTYLINDLLSVPKTIGFFDCYNKDDNISMFYKDMEE